MSLLGSVAANGSPMSTSAAEFSAIVRVVVAPSSKEGAVLVSAGFSSFVSDQRPSPAALTARTCTSYSMSSGQPPDLGREWAGGPGVVHDGPFAV